MTSLQLASKKEIRMTMCVMIVMMKRILLTTTVDCSRRIRAMAAAALTIFHQTLYSRRRLEGSLAGLHNMMMTVYYCSSLMMIEIWPPSLLSSFGSRWLGNDLRSWCGSVCLLIIN